MSESCPEGWASSRLREVAELISGAGFPLEHQGKKGLALPFFKVGNLGDVESGQPLVTSEHTVDLKLAELLKAKVIPANSILFAKIGMAIRLNRRRLLGVPACIDNNMMAAISSPAIEPPFLLRFLETVDFMPLTQATTVPSLRRSDLDQIELSIPPLAEQRRIVAKVEALLAEVNAARERLAKMPAILKRFRQSVLAEACSGRLTEEWRQAHPGCDGHALLRSLLAARASTQEVPKKRGKAAQEDPTPELTGGSDIPDCWAWASFGQVAGLITKGSSPGWQGFDYVEKGVLFVRSQNVRWGEIDVSERVYVEERFNEQHTASIIREGDVLLNLVGASVGRTAVATKALDGANCNQAVGIIRLADGGATSRWVTLYLLSPGAQVHIATNKADVARANFNLDDIKSMVLPLPSRAEQDEIARRVEALFKVADAIGKHVATATARADKITQAVLAKAFRGELVPTEAELAREEGRDYEPANVLLERIAKERATSGTGGTKKRPKRDAA